MRKPCRRRWRRSPRCSAATDRERGFTIWLTALAHPSRLGTSACRWRALIAPRISRWSSPTGIRECYRGTQSEGSSTTLGTAGGRRIDAAVIASPAASDARHHMFAEQLDRFHRIGGKTDRQHQALCSGLLGRKGLPQTIGWRSADGEPPRQVVEQAELLHELDVGLAGPRAVAPAQLQQRLAILFRHAARLQVFVADDIAGEEGQHGADLIAGKLAVLVTVQGTDLPDLDLGRRAASCDRRFMNALFGVADV